uniref:HMG box domain-containing protein n=1 Tax=Ditylenchus dipsaci TaxID=166011 RepID=A0A915DBP1_9BILA
MKMRKFSFFILETLLSPDYLNIWATLPGYQLSNQLSCVNTTFTSVSPCGINFITPVEKPAVKPQNFVIDLGQEATSEIEEEEDEEVADRSMEASSSSNSQEVYQPYKHYQHSSSPRLVLPRKAFNYYMSEHRYRIRKTYPHLAKNEVNTQALKEWNRLQDKSKYHMLALEDKMRYEEEKQCGNLPRPTKTRKTRLSK